MNTLQEKRALLALAQRFGQPPAPGLVEEIQRLEEEERCSKLREAQIRQRIAEDLQQIWGENHELVQSSSSPPQPAQAQTAVAEPEPQPSPESTAQQVARVITEAGVVAPEPVLARPGRNLEAEVRRLEQWVSRIAATGPGGGEVNLRYLDDVDRSSIDDHLYLRYDAGIKKFTFDHGHVNNFHLQAQSHLTQTSSATSANAMVFEVTDFSYGMYVDGGSSSQMVITHPGTYNLQFSVQLFNVGNAPDRVYIWLSKNGQDIENSNSIVTVPAKNNANAPGAVIASWNFMFSTQTSDEYVQLKWFVDDETHTYIAAVSSQAATATTPYLPAVPSVIVTVTPVKIN
jgi:hypothetical protein